VKAPYIVGAVVCVVVVAGALFAMLHQAVPPPVPSKPAVVQAPVPAPPPPAPAAAVPPAPQASADCLLPGPPPAEPDGSTADATEMHDAHERIQAFVLSLENYQACRNAQVDHAAPTVSAQQKQTWVDQGNSAVDEANALAADFSHQLQLFKNREAKAQQPPAAAK